MTNTTEGPLRIELIDRLANSRNGYPRYKLTFSTQGWGGVRIYSTATDASVNYDIGNPGYRVLDVVEITLNGRGTITHITPVGPSDD